MLPLQAWLSKDPAAALKRVVEDLTLLEARLLPTSTSYRKRTLSPPPTHGMIVRLN